MGVHIRPMTLFYACAQSPRHGTSLMDGKLETLQFSLCLYSSLTSYIHSRLVGHLACCYVIHWPFLAFLLQQAYRHTLSHFSITLLLPLC